ncbi:cation diffusion facilitator family transporter [Candidatus Microthrix sp.]|jgi:divalent metal cation (Fe/Co/Zn/Cd) transporter|uniref:cation diffusion facilitator family transporter n=1 Tax=Candidatus Neomicrothrix sp. TaxID=2719034 RepID=UPI001B448575|nr:cation transporter [Candidatus Microthrix sp.]MBP8180412.1 cation transporter [Acidimicrobiia bacterium]MBP9066993.1 cation transporter [Candidatus Microthrix sp.]HMS48691.1 cation transporter [Candidatus Microthrix sp.]
METTSPDRPRLLAWATALAIFTIAYNLGEGAIAITAALVARSQALLGFGFDSAVESISASVFLWRLRAERRDPERAERVEHQATRLIGISFFILAAVVAFEALRSLIRGEPPDASPVGIALTAASLIVMPILAWKKRQVATELDSRAGLADSAQTFACVYLSAVVLAGLILNSLLGWWWADPAAALGIVSLLLNEGREALFDDD